MSLISGFNANEFKDEVNKTGTRPLLPKGSYKVMIASSHEGPNNAGTGETLRLDYEVVDGEFKGHVVKEWFNMVHPNPKAVSISKVRLASICLAVGVTSPQDPVELHNIPFQIDVVQKTRQDNGQINNEVKRAYKHTANSGSGAEGEREVKEEEQVSSSVPPWER